MNENLTQRFDPEYFNKDAVQTFRRLENSLRLEDFVRDGYRVVYENTKVVAREEGEEQNLPFFLQSADINTPFINEATLVCVPEADWVRYPKGRVKEGELLIEVKGKAAKIAVVPPGFPAKTLVTGTCFKLTTKEPWQRSVLTAHLLGKYGGALKDRLKTNLLVAYIAKSDLYRIPVPDFSPLFNARIHELVEAALRSRTEILERQSEADAILLETLCLGEEKPSEPLSYSARASDVLAVGRLDAQFFMPAKLQVARSLSALPGSVLGSRMDSVKDVFVPNQVNEDMLVRNFDVTDALVPLLDAEKEPQRAGDIGSIKKIFKDGDVAISRLRAYLREIAVVRTGDDMPSVGSSEFIVLRPKKGQTDISPETMMVFLRSAPVQTILKWCQDGSQHPRFSEANLLSIPVPDTIATVSRKITAIVQDGFAARHKARFLLDVAKRAVEIAIEDGEPAAQAYLDQLGKAG